MAGCLGSADQWKWLSGETSKEAQEFSQPTEERGVADLECEQKLTAVNQHYSVWEPEWF